MKISINQRSRRGDLIKLRALKAEARRDHREHHEAQAVRLDQAADEIQAVLDANPNMPEEARADGERQIINYRAMAMSEHNKVEEL